MIRLWRRIAGWNQTRLFTVRADYAQNGDWDGLSLLEMKGAYMNRFQTLERHQR